MYGWMHSRVHNNIRLLVKIRSIQLEKEFSKICVGSVINCLRPYEVIKECNGAPSEVVVLLMDQFVDLVLKSPNQDKKCFTTRYISYNFRQIMIKE